MKRFVRLSLRLLAVAAIIAAIVDVPIPGGRAPRSRVYVVDASGSVGAMGTRDALRAFEADRKRLPSRDSAKLVAFGGHAMATFDRVPSVDRDATDVGAALDLALTLAEGNGEIILATDGRDTAGHLDRALVTAAALGIPVHVLPIGPVGEIDVRIAEIDVPAQVARDATFDARITLESTGPAKGSLNGMPFEFASATRQTIVLRSLSASSRLALKLDVVDICPENNVAEATLLVRTEHPRVLAPEHIAATLPPAWTVETSGRPQEFDAVIIDRLMPAAVRAVTEHGVGLIVLGGSASYAPGGFGGTPLEEIMPLWAFPEERSTVVFVLDASGSMNATISDGLRRIDAAMNAITASLSLVHKDDSWALVAFAGAARTTVELRQGHLERLPGVSPSGETRLVPALAHALAVAASSPTDKKRIVLITDGETSETADELESIAGKMAASKAQLTIVVTGSGDPKLPLLGGTIVHAADITRLSDVMRDALARNHELTTDTVSVELHDHPAVTGLGDWPRSGRINRTSAKKTAQLLATSGANPVLALGTAGRGRVAAATFALEDGWAGGLAGWPGLSTLLQRLVMEVSPPAPGIASASARLDGNEIVFSIRAADSGDAIEAHPVRLLRRGKGLFEGRVSARSGTTVLRVAGRAVAAFTLPHALEYSAIGPDAAALQRIARLTGGRMFSRLADLDGLPQRTIAGRISGRTLFVVTALIAFLIELAAGIFWPDARPK